jgi:hypothetical protein
MHVNNYRKDSSSRHPIGIPQHASGRTRRAFYVGNMFREFSVSSGSLLRIFLFDTGGQFFQPGTFVNELVVSKLNIVVAHSHRESLQGHFLVHDAF